MSKKCSARKSRALFAMPHVVSGAGAIWTKEDLLKIDMA
jgi:hypothetical protein